jgi:hypothetical protein
MTFRKEPIMDAGTLQELQELGDKIQDHLEETSTSQYKLKLPPYLREEIQRVARRKGMSMADLIRYSVKLYLTITAHMPPGAKLVIQEEGKPDQIIVVV